MNNRAAHHAMLNNTKFHFSKIAVGISGMLLFSGCKLEALIYEPLTTPEEWCKTRPCIDINGFVFNEPLGSFLVFLLAALWILSGVYFLRKLDNQKSRFWFGVSLLLGGIGAAQAGISYQAFSYMLKCAGREYCLLTNGFEVGYSLTQALSVSAMTAAIAYALAKKLLRKIILWYAILNALIYLVITIIGVVMPNKFLLSFEVLMLFALPGILLEIILSGSRYLKNKSPLDASLFMAGVLMILVQAAYFLYYAAGITQALYQEGAGFYFSENDVLHVGMILWLWYIVKTIGKNLKDIPALHFANHKQE
jgi:hypothetical protein